MIELVVSCPHCGQKIEVSEHSDFERIINLILKRREEKKDKRNNTFNPDTFEATRKAITYLNQKTGRNLHQNSRIVHRMVSARLNEGHNLDDFYRVIDIKCQEWLDDAHWAKFLRPSTLFGPKFNEYLNQEPVKPTGGRKAITDKNNPNVRFYE